MLLNCVSVTHTSRSSHPEVLCKKWCSKNLNKIHRKTPVPESPFFNKHFSKKETLTQVFSCEFCEISRNTYFHTTPVVATFIHHVTALLFLSKQFKKAIKTADTFKTMQVRVTTTLLFPIILVANLIDGFLNTEFSLIVQGEVIKEIIQSDPSISLKDCIKQCMHLLSCVSLNYNTQTYECQLSDKEVKKWNNST